MRQSGVLKVWTEKSFGFVSCEGRRDVFLHLVDCEHGIAPQVGDVLSFEVTETAKGARAIEARIETDQA